MKVAIYTLGCKVNQYETQAMEQELVKRGHTLVPFEDKSDAYIVNTCTVTAVSDRKSRTMLRRAKNENPEAIVAACGCYAQVSAEELETLGIDIVAGTSDRMAFIDLLEQEVDCRQHIVAVDDSMKRRTIEHLPAGGISTRTRAMLKIEDGCTNFCTYCIIPYARGPVRSLPLDVCRAEAERLAAEGYREVVITGIEISSYGRDLEGKPTLIDAVEAVADAAKDMRVRLGSLEPRTITEDFCERAAKVENLCPHFHLSMQSGCDETLKRMGRKYSTERYFKSVSLLRKYFDNPAVTTDMIVGFPGETEEEFAASLEFIKKCGFADMHIFPYSIRKGTPAAAMEQIQKHVKEERAARAGAAAKALKSDYLSSCIGKIYPVLFEQEKGGVFSGHAPNYTEVRATGENLHNSVRSVRICDEFEGTLRGELM